MKKERKNSNTKMRLKNGTKCKREVKLLNTPDGRDVREFVPRLKEKMIKRSLNNELK